VSDPHPPPPLGSSAPGTATPRPAAAGAGAWGGGWDPVGDSADRRRAVLDRVGIFQQLPAAERDALAQRLTPSAPPPGTLVVAQGDPGDAMYLIESGSVTVEVHHDDQQGPQRVARLGPGEFFGEVAILRGGVRGASVRTEGQAVVWALPGADVTALAARHPDLGRSLLETAELRSSEVAVRDYAIVHQNLATLLEARREVTIGRLPDNDLVLESRLVSGHHAIVRAAGAGFEVHDLGSSNGTYVNGAPVRTAALKDGDRIWVADQRLVFDRSGLRQIVEPKGIRIDATGLHKVVRGGKDLLQDISLSILPGDFVAIVGGSGAGKSTLMDALSGVRPPTGGTVRYNGADFAAERARYRHTLGYVPQDDIIHRDLPVRATLDYAAQLPLDTSKGERAAAVDQSLEALGLTGQRDIVVKQLSGGQRKRASIGVELLTKPRVFFLDEPTSGLDPATDTQMMELMRDLARRGSTVVLTTHATKNVALCDTVVFLARGGYLAFAGPPARALEYFEVDGFDQIYVRLAEEATPAEWAQRFLGTEDHRRLVEGGQQRVGEVDAGPARRPQRIRRALRQFSVLSRRTGTLYIRNPVRWLPLIGPPVLFSLLILALLESGVYGPDTPEPGAAVQLTFLLAFSTFVFGLLYGVQEIVQEFPIFNRERLVDLGVVPYVLSKTTFLAPVLVLTSTLMIAILWGAGRLPAWDTQLYANLLVTMALTNFAGLGLALFTSAVSPTSQTATDLVTVWVMPQVLFSGALFPVPTMEPVGRALSVVTGARFSFEGIGRSAGLPDVLAGSPAAIGQQILASYGDTFDRALWQTWAILVVFALVPLVGAALVLRRRTRR
jgi:ABC-type multidrug transport system ATPase subunit/CRP-like cAMP-binding protein/ABC-type multidrug transport system permease subunit